MMSLVTIEDVLAATSLADLAAFGSLPDRAQTLVGKMIATTAKAQLQKVRDNRLNRSELRYELVGLVSDLLCGRLWSGDAIEAILALLPTEED